MRKPTAGISLDLLHVGIGRRRRGGHGHATQDVVFIIEAGTMPEPEMPEFMRGR
jgi:hypothetical protein